MLEKLWVSESRKNLVCVDSYENGILSGRLYGPNSGGEAFRSLSQFLVMMERQLDETQSVQSYTSPRTFTDVVSELSGSASAGIRRGSLATFEVKVLFRQHTSWQGVLHWKEEGKEQSFRSVLELILLMDSALRSE